MIRAPDSFCSNHFRSIGYGISAQMKMGIRWTKMFSSNPKSFLLYDHEHKQTVVIVLDRFGIYDDGTCNERRKDQMANLTGKRGNTALTFTITQIRCLGSGRIIFNEYFASFLPFNIRRLQYRIILILTILSRDSTIPHKTKATILLKNHQPKKVKLLHIV